MFDTIAAESQRMLNESYRAFLQGVDVDLPLGVLCVVTGVAGSHVCGAAQPEVKPSTAAADALLSGRRWDG